MIPRRKCTWRNKTFLKKFEKTLYSPGSLIFWYLFLSLLRLEYVNCRLGTTRRLFVDGSRQSSYSSPFRQFRKYYEHGGWTQENEAVRAGNDVLSVRSTSQ